MSHPPLLCARLLSSSSAPAIVDGSLLLPARRGCRTRTPHQQQKQPIASRGTWGRTCCAMAQVRKISKKVLSVEQSEGAGARVRRSIGRPELRQLDPFLLLDEFRVARPAGFPDHPHRGFETVTYMLKGAFVHEDFMGHYGKIEPGDLQWMTAGKGIVHCEMPASAEESHGLQLWVNLPKADKMCQPGYQELLSKDIPKPEQNGVKCAVIAGEALGAASKVLTKTPICYLDFTLEPGAEHIQTVPKGWNAFAYVVQGQPTLGQGREKCESHTTVVFDDGDSVLMANETSAPARLVLLGGRPIKEPVQQYGPFVMTTQEEIRQAMSDYQRGKNGFEKAPMWKSKTGSS